MAKNLNAFDLKDTGGVKTVNKQNSGRKENLPDLTTSFANALTQGADSLTKSNSVEQVKKAATNPAPSVPYKNYAERNTSKKQNLGNLNSVAVSSLVGSNATQEERKEAALRQNKIMGAAHQNLAAQQKRSKGNAAYMLSDIIGQTNGIASSATSSLTGSGATPRENAKAWNRSTALADTVMNGSPVHQITDWSTGDPLTNKLVNALDQKTQTSWEQADEIAAAAQENYGQYLTPRQQTISNVITNIEDNSIRMGKRMALSFLTGGSSLLTGVVGDTAMYLSSAGEALKDARDKGYSGDTARKYASVVGIANAGLEHLGDPTGTESYGLGLDKDLGDMIRSAQFLSPKAKWVANWLAGGFEEGLEEMLTEAITQKAEKYYLDEDISSEQQVADRINAFGMGMISSLFLSGVLQGDMMPGGYQKYAGEIALDYWRMDNADRAEVVDALAREFRIDPALLQKSIEDHALDAVKNMDGETLMRAIEDAPVAIMPNGEGVYEYFGDTTKQQKDALKLAARPGNKAYLVETLGTDSKGYAIPSATLDDGTVLISSEVEDPMNGIATHEVVHVAQDPQFIAAANQAMRETMGSEFDSWFDSLKGAYAPMYTDQASTAVDPRQRIQENTEYGRIRYESDPVFRQKIDEEVASYFAQYHLLKDQKTFDRFMNRTGNLLQRTIQSLKDNLAGTGDRTLVSNLENQYTRMVQNYQKQNRGNFLSRLAGNLNTNKLSPQVSYSLKSMGIDLAMGTDSEMVQDLLNTGVFQTNEEATAFVNNVNQLMDLLSQRAFLDMNEEADRDTRAFSPIKKNSDKLYEISLDYSTLCKKRIITQAIIEKLNVERGQALDARTQFAITELLRQYQQQESKLQVACALCYVEAARLKSPKVINQFINDPAKYMTSYFVKQGGSEGKQIVADAQNNFKTMLGVDPKATKTDMADSVAQRMTVGEFNDVLRSIGAAEIDGDPDAMVTPQKVKNAYNNYAVQLRESLTDTLTDDQKAAIELAKSLDRKYYLTAQGLTDLKMGNVNGQYNPLARDIYNAFTNRVTTATRSKAIETDVAYYYGDAKGVSDSLIERMNAENGLRTQSWSDFTMQHLLDEITSTAELATRNAKMHGYTKVPEYVLVKGKTGEMINNSLIPLGRTGFDEYGNLAFSPTEGMPIEESNRLRGIFPNTDGSICIGINDEQIRALLRDDRIDYVIPYHVSGLTSHLRTIAGINKWSNYTGTQNETPIPGRKQGAAIKFSDWYTDDIKNQKKPGIEIMMDAQQKYLDLCAERGYVPKFPQFLINNGDGTYSIDPENPNYWKLLIDRKMINQLNGKIIEQKAVRPDFNWEDTYVNGERVPGLFSLVKEAEDPMTTELVERMASVVRNAIDDGTVNAIAENNPNVRGVMDFFIQNNPIEQLGEEDVDEYEWNGDPYDPETRVQENLPAAMYSLSDEDLDQQYFDALERGDMDEAQRLRLAHAAENGYTDRAYHGTQAFGFTEPDVSYSDDGKSFFVTDDRDVAKTYAGTDVVKPISGNNGTWLDNEIHNTEEQIDASVNDFIDALNQVAGNTNWHPDVSQLNSDLWTIASNYVDNTAVNANSSLSKDIDDELFHWIGKAWQEGNPGENNMMPWLMSSESDYVSEVEDKVIDRFGRFINLINGTDTNRGIYDLVINPDNLLEHDAKGKKWNDLDIINEQGGRTKETTRSLADYAQGEGYNGYVLNNVFDDGGFGATRQQNPATVYDLFDPGSQVKSADTITYDDNGNIIPLSQRDNPDNPDMRYSLSEDIPEQANAFPDRNYPQDRGAMRMLGQMSRDRVAADPLTYESISPESFPVPDRIQDYIDLMEDEEDRKYGFDEAPEKELSDEDRDMYKSIAGNKSGALQGFATPTQMFNNMMGKEGEQREFFRDRYERPMFDTKKEYNANREQRWQALENMMKETGIQANTPESAAVQWYGEKVKPNEQGETVPYTLNDLKREFPNKWEDIVKMEQFMRGMYDEYVGRINAALEQVYPNLEEKAQAQLESWRNKIRVYQDEIEMSRNPVANEYWQNEIAKLDKKIAKLEGDLESGEYFRNKRLNPRQDYFHHFQEVETKGIGGLKNILQASTLIDPQLVGKTEFTKPKSRWMNWLQKRGQGAYTADAVLGMGKYIDSAEYAIAFDPLIAQYRDEISNMVKATRDTKNANQLIQYLSSYTNQLAGKTASLDRTVLDLLGEGNRGQLFNALAALNNRAKSNAVVGNIRSAVSQLFNIPNAMSIVKSNTAWAKGVRDYANTLLQKNRELLDQSPFLQERYFDHNVDDLKARNTTKEKLIGKAGDVTNWMMEVGDKVATEIIWLSAYNEGIEKGVSDPIYYADDMTRQSVAGRGIGEVPYNMKSKVASFFMPFQVETNNQWQNMKGMVKDKDVRGILRLMLGSYLMNALIAKPLFNDGVLPDILDVILQGIKKLRDKDREESTGEVLLDTAKRAAGEAVSYIPGTSLWLPAIMSSDSAEALFGDSDPTRYGTGTVGLSTITKTLADAVDGDDQFDLMSPLLQLGLPYGGKQISRLYNTLQDFNVLPSNGWANTPINGEKTVATGDYSKAGNLKYRLPDEVNSRQDAMEIARAFLFGSNATDAAEEYFESGKPALNKDRVERYKDYADVVDIDDYIQYLKEANTDGKNGVSQREAYNWLSNNENLSDEERNALWSLTSKSWQKSYDEYEPQNETLVNNADEDGDGRVTQEEAYNWLSQQKDMSDSEKAILWSQNGWKKAYDEYARSEQKKEAAADLGYTLKNLTEVADSDKSGTLKQAELYNWLQSQNFSEDEKSKLWDLGGWKTDYQSYSAKQKGKTSEPKTTEAKTTESKPSDPSQITNRKELLIAADSNNDGYMSQKEAYTYLSGTDLSEEEKEALWNLSNWKTSYQKYKQKNG